MNLNGTVYVTQKGLQKMNNELSNLINVRRIEVAARLEVAISHGDLSENADYDDAKKEQAFVEGRIQDLQDSLRNMVLIEDTPQDCVGLGSTVTITEEGWDVAETYKIVGKVEANPLDGMISHRSPLGSALIGARAGDIVVALTPGGESRFTVQGIG